MKLGKCCTFGSD